MKNAVCRLCLASAVYTIALAALGNAATDQLVMTGHTGGQYTYAIDFGAAHNFVLVRGQQIKLTGLSGVTGVALLNPFTVNFFDAPAVTANSVILTVAATAPATIGTGGLLPLMSITSTVLKADGVGQFQVQDGTQTISGVAPGPGTIPLTVWRPTEGGWYLNPASGAPIFQQWGVAGDIPVAGDFDGDHVLDYAVWRPSEGNWYVLAGSGSGVAPVRQWGFPGDIPVAGDFDGDGKADFAVWRPSDGTWYIIPSGHPANPIIRQWGLSNDIPVVADFDGDGKADLAVWRPSEGNWYISLSSTGATVVKQWGLPGDMPVAADFDGDGRADYAVWRSSEQTWFIVPSSTGASFDVKFGSVVDIPVPRDYDGDGRADIAVWRPTTGVWGILPSATPNTPLIEQWGFHGDIPVYALPQH